MSVRLSYAQFSDSFTVVFDVGWLPLCGLLVACCRVTMQSDWAFLSPTLLDTTALRPAALNVALASLNVWPVTSGAAPATPVPTRATDAAPAATPAPSTMNFFTSDWPPCVSTHRGCRQHKPPCVSTHRGCRQHKTRNRGILWIRPGYPVNHLRAGFRWRQSGLEKGWANVAPSVH